jgi:hypothetical protein
VTGVDQIGLVIELSIAADSERDAVSRAAAMGLRYATAHFPTFPAAMPRPRTIGVRPARRVGWLNAARAPNRGGHHDAER